MIKVAFYAGLYLYNDPVHYFSSVVQYLYDLQAAVLEVLALATVYYHGPPCPFTDSLIV